MESNHATLFLVILYRSITTFKTNMVMNTNGCVCPDASVCNNVDNWMP